MGKNPKGRRMSFGEKIAAAAMGAAFESIVEQVLDGSKDFRANARRALDAIDDVHERRNPRPARLMKGKRGKMRPNPKPKRSHAPDEDVIEMERAPDGTYKEKKT